MGNNDIPFVDPLENYDPKTYDDPLEKAIAEETVSAIKHQPQATIDPSASVASAIHKLAAGHVACLLVAEDDRLVGVFTDREVLNKVATDQDAMEKPVGEYMTSDPVFVYEDDPAAAALCVMAVSGYRHVPVVDNDLRIKGIISPKRVTEFLSQHLT